MENISIHNYEAFWLDYIEGNLDDQATEQLMAFLDKHPGLKPDLFSFELPKLEAEEQHFDAKDSLKHNQDALEEKIVFYLDGALSPAETAAFEQEISESPSLLQLVNEYSKTILPAEKISYGNSLFLKKTAVSEDTLIAYIENQLSSAERKTVEDTLKTDEIAALQLNLYKKTINEPDTSLVYPGKEELKREARVIGLFTYRSILSIAASVVLLLGIFWLMRNNNTGETEAGEGTLALKPLQPLHKEVKNSSSDTSSTNFINATNTTIAKSSNSTSPHTIKNKTYIIHNNQTPVPAIANNNSPLMPENKELNNNGNKEEHEPVSLIAMNPYKETDAEYIQPTATVNENGPAEKLARQINKAAWGEEDEKETISQGKKKIKAFDMLALVGKGLRKLGNQRSDAKKIKNENDEYTEYVVTIGSLSVSRKGSN